MLARWRTAWVPGAFVRNVGILAGGTAAGQAIVLLASPIISRLYDPEAFGVYAAAASMISILSVLAPLGYQRAIALPDDREQAAAVVVLSTVLSLAMTVLVAVGFVLLGDRLLRLLNVEQLAPYLWLVVPGQLAAAVYVIVSTWAVRVRAFGAIARTRLTQSAGLVGLQLALAGVGGGLGLVAGDIIGRSAGTVGLATQLWRAEADELRRVTRAALRAIAVRYRRFPIYSNASSLLDTFGIELPTLILLTRFGPEVGGLYLLVSRVAGAPAALIGMSASQVFLADAARIGQDGPRLGALVNATLRRLLAIGLLPAVIGAVIALVAFPFVFGSQWTDAGIYFSVLVPMYLLQFVTSPTGATLAVLERQDVALVREVLRVGLLLLAVAASWLLALDPLGTVVAIGITGSLGYVVYQLATWWSLRGVPARP